MFLFNQFDAYSDDIYLFKNVVNILNSLKLASCLFVYHLSSKYLIFRSCISKMLNEAKKKQKEIEFGEGRRREEGEGRKMIPENAKVALFRLLPSICISMLISMVWLFLAMSLENYGN